MTCTPYSTLYTTLSSDYWKHMIQFTTEQSDIGICEKLCILSTPGICNFFVIVDGLCHLGRFKVRFSKGVKKCCTPFFWQSLFWLAGFSAIRRSSLSEARFSKNWVRHFLPFNWTLLWIGNQSKKWPHFSLIQWNLSEIWSWYCFDNAKYYRGLCHHFPWLFQLWSQYNGGFI